MVCDQCGTDGEIHQSEYAEGWVCEACYCAAAPPTGWIPKPPPIRRPRLKDPDWVLFRQNIIARMVRDGAFYYIAHDRIAGRCPICGDVLGVRFIGRTPQAKFVCHDGCDELDITERLGRANDRIQG